MGDAEGEQVAHSLQSDEILLFNNKSLEHSTGRSDNPAVRHLLRYNIEETIFSRNIGSVTRSQEEKSIPSDQAGLKEWLKQEIGRLDRIVRIHRPSSRDIGM